MHFHGVAGDFLIPAVEAIFQLFAREHRARLFDQGGEQGKFSLRQGQRLVVHAGFAAERIDAECAQSHFGLLSSHLAALQGVDPGDEFIQIERFDEVVVGTQVEAENAVRDGIARGHHQHRDVAAATTQFLEQGDTIEQGQSQIEQQQAIAARVQRRACGATVTHPIDDETREFQATHHARPDHGVVFSQEKFHAAIIPVSSDEKKAGRTPLFS